MHELAICERVVDLMERELARLEPAPSGVACVRLVVGDLHRIARPLLRDAYASLTRDGLAAGSSLEIQSAPVVGECPCGWSGELEVPWFVCADCESVELELVGGRELYLESIEIVEAAS